MHVYIHTHIQTYMHTYIYIDLSIYMHPTCVSAGPPWGPKAVLSVLCCCLVEIVFMSLYLSSSVSFYLSDCLCSLSTRGPAAPKNPLRGWFPGFPARLGSFEISQESHGGLPCCHVAPIKAPRGTGWRPRGSRDGLRCRKKPPKRPRRPPRRVQTSPGKPKSLQKLKFSL